MFLSDLLSFCYQPTSIYHSRSVAQTLIVTNRWQNVFRGDRESFHGVEAILLRNPEFRRGFPTSVSFFSFFFFTLLSASLRSTPLLFTPLSFFYTSRRVTLNHTKGYKSGAFPGQLIRQEISVKWNKQISRPPRTFRRRNAGPSRTIS